MNLKCPYCDSLQSNNGLSEVICEKCKNTIYIFDQDDLKIISYTTSSVIELLLKAIIFPVLTAVAFFVILSVKNDFKDAFLFSGIAALFHPLFLRFSSSNSVLKTYIEVILTFNMQELTIPKKIEFISSLLTLSLGLVLLTVYFFL